MVNICDLVDPYIDDINFLHSNFAENIKETTVDVYFVHTNRLYHG